MKFTKSVSMICLMTVCGYAHAVNITPQIQRLLNEKQEKMAELEKCEGKKKGFMIAGISTIGLTAGGIALNIVQANKSSKLSDELDEKNKTLSDKQGELSKINADVEQKRRDKKIAECTQQGKSYDPVTDNCKEVSYVPAQVKTNPVPVLDDLFDGVIGQKCGEAAAGIWTVVENPDKKCINETQEIVNCSCVEIKNSQIAKPTKSDPHAQRSMPTVSPILSAPQDNQDLAAVYASYTVKCDGTKERFEFIDSVPGAAAHMSRIRNECKNGHITETRHDYSYSDTNGNNYNLTGTVIECVCDKKAAVTLSESGREKLSGGAEPNVNWKILEEANRGYGITQDYFCEQIQNHSGYIAYTISTDDAHKNVGAQVEYGAGMGYWCNKLGGEWTVKPSYGINSREWKCANLDVVKKSCGFNSQSEQTSATQKRDWSRLKEPTENPANLSKVSFCSLMKNDSSRGSAIRLSDYTEVAENNFINGISIGYWCKHLDGNWRTDQELGQMFWYCDKTDALAEACGFKPIDTSGLKTKSLDKLEPKPQDWTLQETDFTELSNKEKCIGSGGTLWDGRQCWCPMFGHMRQSDDKKTCECKEGHVPNSDGKCESVEEIIKEEERQESERFLQQLDKDFQEKYGAL